jgi:RNA polymerase sigma factor (sigma-70 family)
MSPPHRSYTTDEDARLVTKILHGDTHAYKLVIEQYQKLVVSLVYKMVEQKEDREDLCQEIFLKVYEKLHTFKFQSKLSTWIATIAFNHCTNFLKKKKSVQIDDIYTITGEDNADGFRSFWLNLPGPEKYPDQEMLNKELSKYILKSMDSLSMIQKTVIQLFHQDEFSLDEIALITSLSVNTVKSHLFRGRAIVKAELLKYLRH